MPIIFVIVGALLIDWAIRGTALTNFGLLGGVILGADSNGVPFWKWAIAIFLIAAVGYWKPARPVAVAFLVLVFIVMFVSAKSTVAPSLENIFKEVNLG